MSYEFDNPWTWGETIAYILAFPLVLVGYAIYVFSDRSKIK